MSIDASIPKALYQANIDLALRIAALLQENGTQWFDLFAEEASARLARGLSPSDIFKQGLSPEKLASLPADVAGQLLQLDSGRWQALLSRAVQNQARFAEGVQAALNQWQSACTNTLGPALADSTETMTKSAARVPGLSDMMDSIRQFMSQAAPFAAYATSAAAATRSKATTKSTPEKAAPAKAAAADRPATAKKTPAATKKAATKKAATKKAATKKAATKKVAAKKATSTEAVAKTSATGTRAARKPRKAAKKAPVVLAPALAPAPPSTKT